MAFRTCKHMNNASRALHPFTRIISYPPAHSHRHRHQRPNTSNNLITSTTLRAMRAVQSLLLAFAGVILAAVNGIDLEQVPFFESLAEGDSVFIVQHGPFNFSASCDPYAVRLDVFIEATQEDYIFSGESGPVNLQAGDTASYPGVFTETFYGIDYADGGFVSASGYYVGWNGQSIVGLHIADGASEPLFGDDISCVIAGVVKLIEQ